LISKICVFYIKPACWLLCCGHEVRYIAPDRRTFFFFSPTSKQQRGPVDSNGIDFPSPNHAASIEDVSHRTFY
jgi:hypothetical protein